MSITVKARKNEPIERMLRRMKKIILREKVLLDAREKRYFIKPCEIKRQKKKVAAFNDMLKHKREKLY